MSKDNFIIYGANGYTGRLIVELAVKKGLKPVIAGRNEMGVQSMAKEFDLDCLVFDLSSVEEIAKKIEPFAIVLHCAGPFSKTARPMIKACLKAQVHYLDITGEIEVFEYAASKNEEAKSAGIVVMPGVGFDVVPTDCLASYLSGRLPDADHLELAFKGGGGISKGTALTMVQNIHRGGAIREDGRIKSVPAAYQSKKINFGAKEYMTTTIPWGDVSTAYHSTGIPNIKVYTATKPKAIKMMKWTNSLGWLMKMGFVQRYLKNRIEKSVKGPSEEVRESTNSIVWGRAYNANESFEAILTTAEGYKLTAMTAIGSVEKLVSQSVFPGFKTPSLAFGSDFILEFEQSKREDR